MRKSKYPQTGYSVKTLKNKSFRIIILLLFLVVSFLCICPAPRKGRSQFHSSQLKKITVTSENVERTDYVDSNNQITIAANLGYATIIVTKTENSKLEQYFDDKGEPISRYNGYYTLLQEYDDKGNNTRTAYLDINGEPMIMANGYAIELEEYNENRQAVSEKYYDTEGKPILTPSYGYGKINEYNESGKISRITYIDASGAPMMTRLGYASVTRNYYVSDGPENGRIESEFYFDDTGDPVSLSLGQFGVHKEHDENGRESVLTYLDAFGEPIVTNKGYTTIVRTYHADGSVTSERYYDLKGNPFSLSEGQYGVSKENGQTVYLDQAGKEVFNLKNLLYNQSWLVIVIAMIVLSLAVLSDKRWNSLFLIIYIVAIAYLTLMFRECDEGRINFQIFWSYKNIIANSEARADILKNIWLFIPLGAILYKLYPNKVVLLIPVMISILIEIIQYTTGTGLCELDDMISNGLGGMIGYGTSRLFCDLKNAIQVKGRQIEKQESEI